MRCDPSKAVTTNPAVVRAAITVLDEMGAASITIAESPGGPFSENEIKAAYKACGMVDAAEGTKAVLSYDTSYKPVHSPNAEFSKMYNIITPIINADVIVGISKFKTHSLAKMTGAVKNYFGVIPGVQKFEFHARFAEDQDKMLKAVSELTAFLCREKTVFNVMDAVVGMEGDGPSGGVPRQVGCIISAHNPFALDLLAAYIMGCENSTLMIEYAKEKGYCPESVGGLEIIGDDPDKFKMDDYVFPKANSMSILRHIPKFLSPRPVIDKKICAGCGECMRSCPVKAITVENKKASINKKVCIRCYCCQELCKFKAVRIKKLFIYDLLQ